jgi:hypothetical protein
MGYTHYWYRPKRIVPTAHENARMDIRTLLKHLRSLGIGIAAPMLRPAQQQILFNGNGKDVYESFFFPLIGEMEQPHSVHEDLYVDCCKTARKPYDIAVQGSLIIIKHHLEIHGQKLIVKSDGNDLEWEAARFLCHSLFGYGADFALGDTYAKAPKKTEKKNKSDEWKWILVCHECHGRTPITKGTLPRGSHLDPAARWDWFCSFKCASKSLNRQELFHPCPACWGKELNGAEIKILDLKTGMYFCSKDCASVYDECLQKWGIKEIGPKKEIGRGEA